jgi:hypothetical protein
MIEIKCPVCNAKVRYNGREIEGDEPELDKCPHGNISECIDLWRAWQRASLGRD